MKVNLNRIFNKCLSDIGGETNEDVRLYRTRPKRISRKNFFEQVIWAIWVSGMRRKSADTFLERAEEKGFCWDFTELGTSGKQDFQQFVENLHGRPVPERANKKWKAVYSIAKNINGYSSEEDFRQAFFGGKVQSANLDGKDVQRLVNLELPFIGERNAHFIIRNIGGETIKCDRWIEAFLRYYKVSLDGLRNKLQELQIPLGLFDVVLWAYCEKFIVTVNKFNKHFNEVFH